VADSKDVLIGEKFAAVIAGKAAAIATAEVGLRIIRGQGQVGASADIIASVLGCANKALSITTTALALFIIPFALRKVRSSVAVGDIATSRRQ
jgi:hypothetical protein